MTETNGNGSKKSKLGLKATVGNQVDTEPPAPNPDGPVEDETPAETPSTESTKPKDPVFDNDPNTISDPKTRERYREWLRTVSQSQPAQRPDNQQGSQNRADNARASNEHDNATHPESTGPNPTGSSNAAQHTGGGQQAGIHGSQNHFGGYGSNNSQGHGFGNVNVQIVPVNVGRERARRQERRRRLKEQMKHPVSATRAHLHDMTRTKSPAASRPERVKEADLNKESPNDRFIKQVEELSNRLRYTMNDGGVVTDAPYGPLIKQDSQMARELAISAAEKRGWTSVCLSGGPRKYREQLAAQLEERGITAVLQEDMLKHERLPAADDTPVADGDGPSPTTDQMDSDATAPSPSSSVH